jgi:hypothetical protein
MALMAIRPVTCERCYNAWPSRAHVRFSTPMSSSALAPLAHKCQPAGGSSKAGLGPQLPRPAHGPQTQSRPAAGGASRSMRPGAGHAQSPMA